MPAIRILGASQHNLKNVTLEVPRNALTVFTGVSGSGKSSLAFDTIYREGQRRFLESLPTYARQFLGPLEKAHVERVDGLSPSVAIDQKTVGRSPRSTVGTLTEIHDYLRLLFARLGKPHCTKCGQPVTAQSTDQICDRIGYAFADATILVCAPIVRERRGQFRRQLSELRQDGFRRFRIDGEVVRLEENDLPELAASHRHDIDVVYDRLAVKSELRARRTESIEKCLALAHGLVRVVRWGDAEPEDVAPREELFSSLFACPGCEVDLPELEPRLFSFNSPHGACPDCAGLGEVDRPDPQRLIFDAGRPLLKGGLEGLLRRRLLLGSAQLTQEFVDFALRRGFSENHSWGDLDEETRKATLYGADDFEGLLALVERALNEEGASWLEPLVRKLPCATCEGSRLSAMARAVRFRERGIHELSALPVSELKTWIEAQVLDGSEAIVGTPILEDVCVRLAYLEHVGLGYLSLDRRASTLAGGEAQRLRLASQVGGQLQGVLYVLDEPSIGLHPRDNKKLLETLVALRDQGNTVIVVEHDRVTMETADEIVDVGPGAGPLGGEIVAQGRIADLEAAERSITGAFLSGRETIAVPSSRRPRGEATLRLTGVEHNNLKGIDVEIPLGLLVAVTGVSGSGKSSLINQVLRPALLQKLGTRGGSSGVHGALSGYTRLDKVVVIDQAPIGRSPRSNPATYVKLFDWIRELYAQVPEARSRGYKAARFSFNKEGGRCLECSGAGHIVVEMQFLAPVTVICDACGGRRYNRETLEIRFRGKTIFDVIDMGVTEALEFFRDQPKVHRALGWLERVGLGYMKLGQPSTTLSGGEAQRIKLAAELRKQDSGRTLFILDEPTTGLHFEDVRTLLHALQELVKRGNTVLVIEHNMDVVKVADHVIDLGPEAGEEGGRIVAEGTPEEVSQCDASHTAIALREELEVASRVRDGSVASPSEAEIAPTAGRRTRGEAALFAGGRDLVVRGARRHNLKHVDVRIPHNRMTVITGVSGSGKTSLALDTLFAEGQRRYVESLSTYARRFLGRIQGAPVDSLTGLSPSIAIDQKSVAANPRSTVGTITEIHDYLRLLYARVGHPYCPECDASLVSTTPSRLAAELVANHPNEKAHVLAPAGSFATSLQEASPRDSAAVLTGVEKLRTGLLKTGFTRIWVLDEEVRLDDEDGDVVFRLFEMLRASLPEAAANLEIVIDRVVLKDASQSRIADSLQLAFEVGEGVLGVRRAGEAVEHHFRLPTCPQRHFQFRDELSPRMFSYSSLQGACERCRGLGLEKCANLDRLVRDSGKPLLSALDRRFRSFLEVRRPSSYQVLLALCAGRGIAIDETPLDDYRPEDRDAILFGLGEETVPLRLAGGATLEASWPGLAPSLESWSQHETANAHRAELEPLLQARTCTVCKGGRLRPELLRVRLGAETDRGRESGAEASGQEVGLNIKELTELTVSRAHEFLSKLSLAPRETKIAGTVRKELANRLELLEQIGLGYLTLNRGAGTLSGGEAQRIRLASQLGNRLAGVLYVLDEPTLGLHPRDTQQLLKALEELRELGNTIVLVEHDREVMWQADWIIDIGPGPGAAGGEVVAVGSPADVAKHPTSVTGAYLRYEREVVEAAREPLPAAIESGGQWLEFDGVTHNNLQNVDFSLPLGAMTAVTGVSGSGKSSLIVDVVGEALSAHFSRRTLPSVFREVRGLEHLKRYVLVDQRSIGRSPRSNPATYTGLWTLVRELYASLPTSQVRGWTPGRFSFNVGDGRCAACEGQGAQEVEMHFLSDVWIPCDQCEGKRFNRETLAVSFKGKNIGEVLELEVDAARDFFENQPGVRRILDTLQTVGLGYLKLGQASNTLSGGEAQRVKLARELAIPSPGQTLYVMDEPTTGLHFEDIRKLLGVFRALRARGDTLVVIEHQLDVVRAADWVVDLGPEAGEAGGRIVACGPSERIEEVPESHTGRCLRAERSTAAGRTES